MDASTSAVTVVASPSHERAVRKTLGYLVMLCCLMLCMLGLVYYTVQTAAMRQDERPRATPTATSRIPALPPPLTA